MAVHFSNIVFDLHPFCFTYMYVYIFLINNSVLNSVRFAVKKMKYIYKLDILKFDNFIYILKYIYSSKYMKINNYI